MAIRLKRQGVASNHPQYSLPLYIILSVYMCSILGNIMPLLFTGCCFLTLFLLGLRSIAKLAESPNTFNKSTEEHLAQFVVDIRSFFKRTSFVVVLEVSPQLPNLWC